MSIPSFGTLSLTLSHSVCSVCRPVHHHDGWRTRHCGPAQDRPKPGARSCPAHHQCLAGWDYPLAASNAGSAGGGGLRQGVTSRQPNPPDTCTRNQSPRDNPAACACDFRSSRVAVSTRKAIIRPCGACNVVRSAIGICQRIIRPRYKRGDQRGDAPLASTLYSCAACNTGVYSPP